MRKKQVKKNYLFTFLIGLAFFTLTVLQVVFIDPELIKDLLIPNFYLSFFIPLSLALFFILGALLKNSRRSLFVTLTIIIFLYLRIFGLGTILNLILLTAIIITIEYYLASKKS